MKKTLVLVVDRDDDFGVKGKVNTPVIGVQNCLDAATAFGIADPEDSDLNALYAAVSVCLEIQEDGHEADVALICGDEKVGHRSDLALVSQLQEVLDELEPDSVVLVGDGAEDEYIYPIISSRVHRVQDDVRPRQEEEVPRPPRVHHHTAVPVLHPAGDNGVRRGARHQRHSRHVRAAGPVLRWPGDHAVRVQRGHQVRGVQEQPHVLPGRGHNPPHLPVHRHGGYRGGRHLELHGGGEPVPPGHLQVGAVLRHIHGLAGDRRHAHLHGRGHNPGVPDVQGRQAQQPLRGRGPHEPGTGGHRHPGCDHLLHLRDLQHRAGCRGDRLRHRPVGAHDLREGPHGAEATGGGRGGRG